jgi:hypothetical protein
MKIGLGTEDKDVSGYMLFVLLSYPSKITANINCICNAPKANKCVK